MSIKQHLMFDYECLSVNKLHNTTALELSMFAFNEDRFLNAPYTFDEIVEKSLTVKFSVADQIRTYKTGRDASTVEFWNSVDEKNRKRTYHPSKDDLTLVDAIAKVIKYVDDNRIAYWWSRSNTFDPVILAGQFDHLNLTDTFKSLFPYSKVRDTRSFIDGYFGVDAQATDFIPVASQNLEAAYLEKFDKHYSKHDIATDILRLQLIHRNRHNKD